MAHLLLTGATGLLGGYLLRDALRQNLPVAVLVRRTSSATAKQRIDTVLAPFESERALLRPVVLEGDLSQHGLGLNGDDEQWLQTHCNAVLHSAASISFYREEKTNEPYRSNVDGTRNILDLCQRLGIREFHQVSTAYVCGQRSGRVLETELDVGQSHGNDYEQSKVAAEKMVQAAGFLATPTVYRPSIIVGDSTTGYTTTYHGFYTPLQLAWLLTKAGSLPRGIDHWLLNQLGLTGSERKNIVPVDWVSRVILQIVQTPAAHGRTYHLTSPHPPSAAEITQAISDAIAQELSRVRAAASPSTNGSDLMLADFQKHMDVYRAYFRDHPQFDDANLRRAMPQLPCPAVDLPQLTKTAAFALQANFGWPRCLPTPAPLDIDRLLAENVDRRQNTTAQTDTRAICSLEITGSGGGSYAVEFVSAGGRIVDRGSPKRAAASIRLRSDTLAKLVHSEIDVETALRLGRIVITGTPAITAAAVAFLQSLIAPRQEASSSKIHPGRLAALSHQPTATPR